MREKRPETGLEAFARDYWVERAGKDGRRVKGLNKAGRVTGDGDGSM